MHERVVFARFRYSDLKQAACGCRKQVNERNSPDSQVSTVRRAVRNGQKPGGENVAKSIEMIW